MFAYRTSRSVLTDVRTATTPLTPEQLFSAIERIGGTTGWYAHDWLWQVRGKLDEWMGGVGMSRGRPAGSDACRVNDIIDCWRVVAVERGRLLRLEAEMRLPGRAWLQFDVLAHPLGSRIRQTARFEPSPYFGRLYWYAIYPIHVIVFRGMLRGLIRAAHQPTYRSPTEISRKEECTP
ncbi:MAG: DUF2867 domain-containing protein [Myxococcales bacterium FL481]|nr:MAG: DUF2867 domain-containing protein [Myxococcales bacterium FL481]